MLALRVYATVKKISNWALGQGAKGYLWLAMVSQSGCESVFLLGPAADRLISILWAILWIIPCKSLHWHHQPPDRRSPMCKPQAESLFEDLAPGRKNGCLWLGPLVAMETKFLPLYLSSGDVSFRGFPTYPCSESNLRSPILGQANPSDIEDRQKFCALDSRTTWIWEVCTSLPYNFGLEVYCSFVWLVISYGISPHRSSLPETS